MNLVSSIHLQLENLIYFSPARRIISKSSILSLTVLRLYLYACVVCNTEWVTRNWRI